MQIFYKPILINVTPKSSCKPAILEWVGERDLPSAMLKQIMWVIGGYLSNVFSLIIWGVGGMSLYLNYFLPLHQVPKLILTLREQQDAVVQN